MDPMTTPTRIYKHSSAGTDWAALLLGGGLALTLAVQLVRNLQLWSAAIAGYVMPWQRR